MLKRFLIACAFAALTVHAETIQEQMQALFKERVDIYFKTEGLKRQLDAAVHDPAITSEAIEEARTAQHQARYAYMVASAQINQLEREEKTVPQELTDALAKAAEEYEASAVTLRKAVMEHPKVKVMADELKQADARAEVIKEQYEALQKQLTPEN